MLEFKEFEVMDTGIFASGYGWIKHPRLKIPVKVRWIAIKDYALNWCIYHSLDEDIEPGLKTQDHIKASHSVIYSDGAELVDAGTIREFIDCSPEVLSYYKGGKYE